MTTEARLHALIAEHAFRDPALALALRKILADVQRMRNTITALTDELTEGMELPVFMPETSNVIDLTHWRAGR